MSGNGLTWFTVGHDHVPPEFPRLPLWRRTIAVADDGTVFVPAAITGRGETMVFMRACYDGIPLAQRRGHSYFPADWMAREFPETAEVCATIKRRMREAAA